MSAVTMWIHMGIRSRLGSIPFLTMLMIVERVDFLTFVEDDCYWSIKMDRNVKMVFIEEPYFRSCVIENVKLYRDHLPS